MKIFVPWSEELVEKHPDLVTRLVPYQPGMHCAHQAGDGAPELDPATTAHTLADKDLESKNAA